jgi:hypothetical protein
MKLEAHLTLRSQKNIFQIMNNKCESALVDFHFHEAGITWITENKNLFKAIHGDKFFASNLSDKQCVHLDTFYNTYINALVVFAEQHVCTAS